MNLLRITAVALATLSLVGCGSRTYQPQIVDGTTAVVQYNKDDAAALAPVRAFIEQNCANLMSDEDSDFAKFWKDSGLEESEIQWCVVSCVGLPDGQSNQMNYPEVAVALAVKHSARRVLAAFKAAVPEEDRKDLIETIIAGEFACQIAIDDLPDGVKPCATSLDGSLLLFAATPDQLARQIKLYRDGEGASKTLVADTSAVIRCSVSKVGDFVKLATKDNEDQLSLVDLVIPNGKEMLFNLGDFNLSLTAAGDTATLAADLATQSPAEATALATTLTPLVSMLKANVADDSPEAGLLTGIRLAAKDAALTVTLPLTAELLKTLIDKFSPLSVQPKNDIISTQF